MSDQAALDEFDAVPEEAPSWLLPDEVIDVDGVEVDAAADAPDADQEQDLDAAVDDDAPDDDLAADVEGEETEDGDPAGAPLDPVQAITQQLEALQAEVAQRDYQAALQQQQNEAFARQASQRIALARRNQLLTKIPEMSVEEIQRAVVAELQLADQATQGYEQERQFSQLHATWNQTMAEIQQTYPGITPEQINLINTTAQNTDVARQMAHSFAAQKAPLATKVAELQRELKQLKRSQTARTRAANGADAAGFASGMATRDARFDPTSPNYDQDAHLAGIFGLRRR